MDLPSKVTIALRAQFIINGQNGLDGLWDFAEAVRSND